MQGIELARTKGVKFGRRHALTGEQVEQLRQQRTDGKKIVELMSEFNISKASVYRALDLNSATV
jgi:DNA invertase Pin-like site-specific DNA recombinase